MNEDHGYDPYFGIYCDFWGLTSVETSVSQVHFANKEFNDKENSPIRKIKIFHNQQIIIHPQD